MYSSQPATNDGLRRIGRITLNDGKEATTRKQNGHGHNLNKRWITPWVGTKSGLWTMDWTMDWIMDWIMDLIMDSDVLELLFK